MRQHLRKLAFLAAALQVAAIAGPSLHLALEGRAPAPSACAVGCGGASGVAAETMHLAFVTAPRSGVPGSSGGVHDPLRCAVCLAAATDGLSAPSVPQARVRLEAEGASAAVARPDGVRIPGRPDRRCHPARAPPALS